jgi:hypothetical protein
MVHLEDQMCKDRKNTLEKLREVHWDVIIYYKMAGSRTVPSTKPLSGHSELLPGVGTDVWGPGRELALPHMFLHTWLPIP